MTEQMKKQIAHEDAVENGKQFRPSLRHEADLMKRYVVLSLKGASDRRLWALKAEIDSIDRQAAIWGWDD